MCENNQKNRIIAVAGPTASGKTALSVNLALALNGEVVSNDSMQVYKGMEIGTAAPDICEMRGVLHHMIGILSPVDDFSCADFAAMARREIDGVIARGHTPILCGGTGLYFDAVLRGDDGFSEAGKSLERRRSLEIFARENGPEALHRRLADVDPECAAVTHPNNVRRVVRALEIYELTGITKTEWDAASRIREPLYDACLIVLDFHSRELLYSRIDRRVDIMLESGLLTEAEKLYRTGLLCDGKPAAQAIGYKELIPYFNGEASLEESVSLIKQNTRRYAKRQMTWFRRYPQASTVFADGNDGKMRDENLICSEAEEIYRKHCAELI